MASQLHYEFDELSLSSFTDANGRVWSLSIHASGRALVEFNRNAEWQITGIEIDTSARKPGAGYENGRCFLAESDTLYPLIFKALTDDRSEDITQCVCEELAQEAADAAMTRAEMRRDARREAALLGEDF